MGYSSPDWQQPAVFLSTPEMKQVAGASIGAGGAFVTDADGVTWTDLAPGAGTVMGRFLANRGAVALAVAYGAASTTVRHTLEPNESFSPPYAGTIRVRSASATAGAGEHVSFEV